MWNCERDIHVQKMLVKNLFFCFPQPLYSNQFPRHAHLIYIIMYQLTKVLFINMV